MSVREPQRQRVCVIAQGPVALIGANLLTQPSSRSYNNTSRGVFTRENGQGERERAGGGMGKASSSRLVWS